MAIIRPSSDIVTTGWSPSAGSTLFETVDEVSASDADYISTSAAGSIARVKLDTTTDPGNDNNHVLRIRGCSPEADRGAIIRLLEVGQPPGIVKKLGSLWKPSPGNFPGYSHPHCTSLIGWWIMNDAGTLVSDISSKRRNATLNSAAKRSPGKYGGLALAGYDYDSAIASVPNTAFADSEVLGPYTLCFWYKKTSSVHSGLFGKGGNSVNNPIMVNAWSSSTLSLTRAHATNSNRWDANISARTGVWDFVVISVSDNLVQTAPKMYINGVLVGWSYATTPATGAATGNGSAFKLGDSTYSGANANQIDDVRLYNRVLNCAEILSIMASPFAAFNKNRIAYFDAPKEIYSVTKSAAELGTTPGTIELAIPSGNIANIGDYSQLAVEVEST